MSDATPPRSNSEWFFTILFIAAAGLLIWQGIIAIQRSNELYTYSKNFIENHSTVASVGSVVKLDAAKDGFATALSYFTLALGTLVIAAILPRLSTINVGPSGVNATLKDIKAQLEKVQTEVNRQSTVIESIRR